MVNRLGGLSLPKKSVVRLTDRPDMTLDVYHGSKTTMQQQPTMLRGPEAVYSKRLNLQQLVFIFPHLSLFSQRHPQPPSPLEISTRCTHTYFLADVEELESLSDSR